MLLLAVLLFFGFCAFVAFSPGDVVKLALVLMWAVMALSGIGAILYEVVRRL